MLRFLSSEYVERGFADWYDQLLAKLIVIALDGAELLPKLSEYRQTNEHEERPEND